MQSKYYRLVVKRVALKEGKKKQTPVGNIREIVKIIAVMSYHDPMFINWLLSYGRRASKPRVKRV